MTPPGTTMSWFSGVMPSCASAFTTTTGLSGSMPTASSLACEICAATGAKSVVSCG